MIELPAYVLVLIVLYLYWSGIAAIFILVPNIDEDDKIWVALWPIMLPIWLLIKVCQFFKL